MARKIRSLISAIAAYVPGYDVESRILRKTLARQCNLMAVLLLRTLCSTNRKKTLDDIVSAGIPFMNVFHHLIPRMIAPTFFRIYVTGRNAKLPINRVT